MSDTPSPKLGDILLSRGAIDRAKLDAALADQQAFGGKLGRTLVDLGYIDEAQLVSALAEQLGLSTIDLERDQIDPDVLTTLPVDACERYGVLPVRLDRQNHLLYLACAEPDRAMLQEVAQIAQLTLEPMLAPMSAIDKAVRRHYYGETTGPKQRLGEPMRTIPLDPGTAQRPPLARPSPKPTGKTLPPSNLPQPAPVAVQDSLASDSIDPDLGAGLSGIAPVPGVARDDLAEIKALLIRLEKAVAAQGRAFRGLVELLQDKGVVRRGELGARTTKK
jgi:type IV pilus assembly protein PilB